MRSVARAKAAASLDIEGVPSRVLTVKAMEAVKSLEAQPRGTPRRNGRGTHEQ
jgi:hypothetical protein